MDCLESNMKKNEIVITSQNIIEKLITYHFWSVNFAMNE